MSIIIVLLLRLLLLIRYEFSEGTAACASHIDNTLYTDYISKNIEKKNKRNNGTPVVYLTDLTLGRQARTNRSSLSSLIEGVGGRE